MSGYPTDLAILVADDHMKSAIMGLLAVPHRLGIRRMYIDVEVHVEPGHDPGCLLRGHETLRPRCRACARAMVIFDRMGCGREHESREALEETVTANLARSGWGDRVAVIVIDPELEAWVWSDSPEVDRCLGWQNQDPDLRTWLRREGLWEAGLPKPVDPKKAMLSALRHVRMPPSAGIYGRLAGSVSVRRCTDPAFTRFRETLQAWFGV